MARERMAKLIKYDHFEGRIADITSSQGLSWRRKNLRCHKICDYMAYTTFKIIIFNQFRHALTRHDPKPTSYDS